MRFKRQVQTNTAYLGAQGLAAAPGLETLTVALGTDTVSDTPALGVATSAGKLSKNVRRCIGFDPGLAATGWAVIDYQKDLHQPFHVSHGVIKTESDEPIQDRVSVFCSEVNRILETYHSEPYPTFICAESYQNYGRVFWNGVQTLYVMGALFSQCEQYGLSVHLLSAKDSKRLIGVKDGQKTTVQKRVQELLGLPKPPRPTHAADALCIALARLYQLNAAERSTAEWSAA